jgi:hypothetical protein
MNMVRVDSRRKSRIIIKLQKMIIIVIKDYFQKTMNLCNQSHYFFIQNLL